MKTCGKCQKITTITCTVGNLLELVCEVGHAFLDLLGDAFTLVRILYNL